jgi:hypothetical protein
MSDPPPLDLRARSALSTRANSYEAGHAVAREAVSRLGAAPALLLVYGSVNHDQGALLRGVRDAALPGTPVVGCSAQGVAVRGVVAEDGYLAGAMALGGGDLLASVGHVEEFHADTAAKGRELGRALTAGLPVPPRAVVLLYDPLSGADMDVFLAGLFEEVGCPILGGGAGQPHGRMVRTYQYAGDRAFSRGAVALALAGPVGLEVGKSHGTSPTGIEMIVTRSEGPIILELDGRPALEVWQEITSAGPPDVDHTASLAVGILQPGAEEGQYLVRGAFGTDLARGGVVLQVGLPPGTPVMLHHRTIEGALAGTAAMGRDLAARLAGRAVRAVLGFECGARTARFLGEEGVLRENVGLQDAIGGDPAWLGLLAWGELCPVGGRPTFHNYAYTLLVLAG